MSECGSKYCTVATGRSSSLISMFIFTVGLGLVLFVGTSVGRANAQSITKVGRYTLQSNPWVNLHQRLLFAARFSAEPPASLTGENLTKWNKAVEDYRKFVGKKHPIFNNELIKLNADLSSTNGSKLPGSIPKEASTVLESAMTLYRLAQWNEDDSANRFWIAIAEALLKSAEEELVQAHTKAYAMPFPTHILVDVSPFGWEFEAYTVGEGDSAHSVISSTTKGYQGFAALEILMHEPSHAIVGSTSGAIGSDLAKATKDLGIKPFANLWHAILFYTSGELTRRALAKRGVPDYKPIISFMYDGPFRGFQKPLETHWQAYLDGKVTRDEAIRQILIETAPTKK